MFVPFPIRLVYALNCPSPFAAFFVFFFHVRAVRRYSSTNYSATLLCVFVVFFDVGPLCLFL